MHLESQKEKRKNGGENLVKEIKIEMSSIFN